MAKVVWRKRAIKDRYAIVEYVAERNPGAALALDADFVAKAHIAVSGIIRHKAGRVRGTHEMVVKANYVMVYRITKIQVSILRVLHARQQWPQSKL
jgi:toxin ParE1/3/4